MRLFDPCNARGSAAADERGLIDSRKIDRRWIRIRRPTIVVGGELTMDRLEITLNTATDVSEAPVQLKSNCGTLVIDDFGRQRMSDRPVAQPLDRAARKALRFPEPGERQEDSGAVRPLLLFSTNLEPSDLVDEAFLRRIPYKIEVSDPSLDDFRKLMAAVREAYRTFRTMNRWWNI